MRKSKFDVFLFYDPQSNEIFTVEWDCCADSIPEFFHYNGNKAWWEKGRDYIERAKKHFLLLDRFPVGTDFRGMNDQR